MRVTPITRLRQSLWGVLHSVYQSDIGSYPVLHEGHLYFRRNMNQTLSNPPRNALQKEESSSAKMPKQKKWVDPNL